MKGDRVEQWEAFRAINGLLGGSLGGATVQVSVSFPASALANMIAGALEDDSKGWPGLKIQRNTRVTGWPAFWRASMNGVNASPASPLP